MYRLHLIIPIVLLGGLLMSVLVAGLLLDRRPAIAPAPTTPANLRVTLAIDQSRPTIGDQLKLFVTVENPTSEPVSYTFPTTCTEPQLLVDERPLASGRLCGQALTSVTLKPHQRQTYQLTAMIGSATATTDAVDGLPVIQVTGQHELRAVWGDWASEGVVIDVQPS